MIDNFKEQFQQLLLEKPRFNLKQVQTENSDYSDTAVKSKNCYYCFGAFYCEDVFYGRYSRKCTDCVGITLCVNCEGCIQCTDCADCYFVSYGKNCKGCSECEYCEDCYSCQNCFGCIGLYRKQYCLFNEQLSKEEYEQWMQAIDLHEPNQQMLIAERIEELKKSTPMLSVHHYLTEDCVGNNLSQSRNCYQCYDSFLLEDCFYTVETNANKDGSDLSVCFETELCYSCVQSPMNFNCNFMFQVDQSNDSEFCAYSKNLKDCFGCVYLQDKQYYILNQPYAKEDYERIVAQLRQQLITAGDYNMSLFHVSDYEAQRAATETDCPIESNIN